MDAVYLKRHPIARPKKEAQAENRLRLSRHAKVLLGGHNNHGVARFAISARFALGTVVTGGTRGARRTGGAGRARGARGTVIAARTRGAGSTGGAWNTHRGAGSAGGTRGTRRACRARNHHHRCSDRRGYNGFFASGQTESGNQGGKQ